MNKKSRNIVLLTICSVFAVVWAFFILLFCNLPALGLLGWFGFFFVLFSFFVAVVTVTRIRGRQPHNDAGLIGIPLYFTAVFLFAAVVINSIFLLFGFVHLTKVLILADVLILAAYIVSILLVALHFSSVQSKASVAAGKGVFTKLYSQKIGQMIALVAEPEVKASLLRLKEAVDSSTNTSNQQSSSSEQAALLHLDKLKLVLVEEANTQKALAMIAEAMSNWQFRNASRSS